MIKTRLNIRIPDLGVYRLGYFGLSALTLALAGCAVAKRDHYDVPMVQLPAQYKNAPVAATPPADSKNIPAKPETQLDPVLVEWWHAFGSRELDDLINRGLADNPDVRIATFRIAQAKARAEQADAGKGPTVSLPVQGSEQYPYYGVGGPVTQGLPYTGPNGEKVKQMFQASIRGDWRVDIWGELDSLAQSANLQLWRASFERDNIQGNVAANIASSYVEYLSLNDRIRVARETETVLDGMLVAVKGRMDGGDATSIDMEQQRSAVYAVRATIPALEQQREDALGTLAFLLGTVPGALKISDSGLDSLSLPLVIPGMPSSLLLRRPDVRMAEARLLAADADIDVARARVLPALDLTVQNGYGGYYLSELFKPQTLFWNVIANLSATIFDGGKLSREKDYAREVHEEMVETYVRTIYQAVREVESALNAISQTESRLEAQKTSADAARRAWDYSSEVYADGAIDYLTLLNTERTYHQSLDEYDRIRMDRYRALVNLFHALGGGVPQGKVLPGKGARPIPPPESKGGVVLAPPNKLLVAGAAPTTMRMDSVLSAPPPAEASPVLTRRSDPAESSPSGKNASASSQQLAGEIKLSADAGPNKKEPGKEAPLAATVMPPVVQTPAVSEPAIKTSEVQNAGVDWSDKKFWLVRIPDVYERSDVAVAWRNLLARFPAQMENRTILPRRQARMDEAGKERASWYRLFIAKFPDKKMAAEFCAMLRAGQQPCSVASSYSLTGKDGFHESSTSQAMTLGESSVGNNENGQQP